MKGILNSANIEQFYPSIGLNLLKECISWARDYVQISKEEEQIIMHCRKSLLAPTGAAGVKMSCVCVCVCVQNFIVY